jgi:cbb3-type cytochrome oxidase maturation protein
LRDLDAAEFGDGCGLCVRRDELDGQRAVQDQRGVHEPTGGKIAVSVIFLLIPLSVLIAAGFLGAFIWAVRSGQFEDTCTPAMRLLMQEREAKRPEGSKPGPSRSTAKKSNHQ